MCPSIGWLNHLVHQLSKKDFIGRLPFWIINPQTQSHHTSWHPWLTIVKFPCNPFALQFSHNAAARASDITGLSSCWSGVLFSGLIVGAGCLELRTLICDLKHFFAEISKVMSCVIGIMCHLWVKLFKMNVLTKPFKSLDLVQDPPQGKLNGPAQ
ncbi:hypothetical protein Tco_0736810 [Tanacetum coccineum]